MSDKSAIEWTDATWNPVRGCTKISPGCTHCYPFKWKKPRRVFVNSMSDLFHEGVPFGYVMQCLWTMAELPWHTFQILTKRPERMAEFFRRWADLEGEDFGSFRNQRGPEASRKAHPSGRGQLFADMLDLMGEPPPGCVYPLFDWAEGMMYWPDIFFQIWLGVSVENRKHGLPRIDHLRKAPARIHFLSIEPLLEDLGEIDLAGIGWVIVGGESGHGARPMEADWARSIRDQCQASGVPFFMKQMSKKGEIPADLMIREFPR